MGGILVQTTQLPRGGRQWPQDSAAMGECGMCAFQKSWFAETISQDKRDNLCEELGQLNILVTCVKGSAAVILADKVSQVAHEPSLSHSPRI